MFLDVGLCRPFSLVDGLGSCLLTSTVVVARVVNVFDARLVVIDLCRCTFVGGVFVVRSHLARFGWMICLRVANSSNSQEGSVQFSATLAWRNML